MPDNSSRGHLRGLGAADVAKAALLAVLLLTPVLVGVSMLGVSVAQPKYSAWLKLVTDSWDGVAVTDPDPIDPPVLPNRPGFADRYNVTNACVEVYRLKSFGGYDFAGTFYPDGTGFVRIEWPSEWQNVTVIVKAKSYQGQCIGTDGNPYSGIIIYWLTVNPTDSFRNQFGVGAGNVTVGDDGIEVNHAGDFDWDIDAPFGSGPVDIVQYDSGPVTFKINHEDARNAWVARAAYIFKVFHEHTWYSVNDVLTYAIITIYDVDHTAASSPHSLLQAAITGSDGQSRYTREIYPASQGVGSGRFADNKLVPIPLQVINLGAKRPFEGGIGAPDTNLPVDAPHLNVTKRVWWETVLVNQTFYVGNEYNGTGDYDDNVVAGKYVPLFGAFAADPTLSPTVTQGGITGVPAGPMSLALNHTVYGGVLGWQGLEETIVGVANLDNNTVFYARFCVQDADLSIQHPEVGDKMVGAEVTINFKTATDRPYYLSHNILTTDSSGCTATPHKWPGYLDEFSKFARFPNGTNWGLRGSLNVSKHFNPADDASPAWRPGGYFERSWGGDWRGPYNNAGKNWSALIPEITYMKTRQLTDDPNYDGFDVQVKWKGGSRNSYGGESVLVDSVRVKNPYAIAALYSYTAEDIFGGWVFPYTELANNKFWLKIHKAASVSIDGDTIDDPIPTLLEIMGPFSLALTNFDSTTGTFDVTITANGPLVVNNATDPAKVVDWTLTSGDDIVIEDALVSFKKHDIFPEDGLLVFFDGAQGQADFGADGTNDYTTVFLASFYGGPMEVEFWPGPPGEGTIRVLISGHDIGYDFVPFGPSVGDGFTGAILLKGPPLQGDIFFGLVELEELFISGTAPPEDGDNLIVDGTPYTSNTLTLNGGILSVGPIVKAMITGADFDVSHGMELASVFEDMTLSGKANETTTIFGDDETITVGGEQSFSISLTGYPTIDITSFVVPLPDLSADNEDLDNRLFGGYDDFALTGTGIVYITAWVHDIAYKIVDNMGNVLPAANTDVTLTRGNGPAITRSHGSNPDQFQSNLAWSYSQWAGADTGYAIFYQLPGDQAYGLTVSFDGQVVHEEQFQIEKLTETVIDTIVVNVVKLKIVIVDCNGETLDSPYFRYIDVRGVLRTDRADQHGARDFGMIAGGGEIKILGVWWKGVWVPFVKATLGTEELTLNPDGSLTITLDRNYDVPVKLYANILDITFTTWDLNKENRIPRLNVTLTWVGEHPLTGRKLWFLETLDPTGDTNTDPFNTTKRVDQFLQYTVEYKQSEPDISGQLKSYGTVEYTFYQMPPTYYNITVTTVTDPDYDPETEQTPGNSKWPGRTDAPVPYEIKIKYTSTSSPPVELTEPADYVNDRVVLRIISTLNPDSAKYGTPVTDTWPFSGAKTLLNPDGVGDFTGVTACNVSRDLLTWAQTFYKRIVDGDGQRRIGDATYDIINDNNVRMEFYNPVTGLFEPSHESFWTEDTVDTTWLKAHSQFSSVIWWNGSYRAENLFLPTNMSLTVNKFWNNSVDVTEVYAKHNFTVQPSLAHFRVMHPWYVANWTEINATVSPYGTAIVFEKETLLLPAPVTFVKPQAIDKGGSPLEGALVESWILDLDTSSSVRIDASDMGSELLTDGVLLSWAWEKKMVADPDEPQKFNLVRWDRVMLTFSGAAAPEGEEVDYDEGDDFDDLGLSVDDTIHFLTPAVIQVDYGEYLSLMFHTSGIITVIGELENFGYTLQVKPGDVITFYGGDEDGIDIGFPPSMVVTIIGYSDPDFIWFENVGTLELLGALPEVTPTTIFVQVPPYPAKLYLRDVLGDLDVVVTARSVTALVDDLDTPDGQLRYGQWKTQANGLIKSFTIPDYQGLLMLPTSGWLADAYADVPEVEEFHYQFNVVWKSAVVYSDNYVLDKRERVFGASEVYDVTFMFTLSNSTATADAVRNLNLWIYYPNVTTWHDHDGKLWYTVPDKPQDYEACEDSAFPCKLRVTLISSADPDGVVQFSKIPGPRFMNTTWKYVFSANHSAITWLDDLVATQFVLNNETFGDGPLKVVTTRTITVPIMLNAAHQLYFLVLGWRDEQGIATAYPLEGFNVRYEIRRRDAGLTVASGTAVSGANGVGEVRSDPTDPRKVLWAGLTVRYRVEPPSWLINVNDAKWKDLLGARNVQVVEYGGYAPDPRPSIGAYYPDEVPTHWAIREIDTRLIGGWCFGLCTAFIDGRQQSKPFVINVDYTIVTVRALDFNGRPLRGAFVEIVERASGRIAGWSYTFGSTWTRQPIDLQTLYSFHRVALLPARTVGGDGYTEFMPVAVGPWNYDANNDDRVDASGYRGDDPRTPSAEGTALQYIVRVYWAATDANPDNANGDLRAIWPFIDPQKPFTTTEAGQSVRKYHVKVYDSDFDETDERAKTLVVPIDAMIEIRKPSELISKYDGKHRDVTTAVFDLKVLLNYEGKTLPKDLKTKIEVWVFKKTGAVSELALRFRGGPTIDTVTVNKLPRGVYEVRVVLVPTGDVIFTRTFDISTVNVGTVQAEASLPFTDLSFEVTDLRGRPLPISDTQVTVEPRELFEVVKVAGNVVTIVALREGAPVTVTVRYSSPVYGTSADASITDSAAGFKTRLLGGRTLQLPVDDVTVTVVDRQGRPIGGAVVKLGQAPAKSTGGDGRAVFERVPLESAGRGITYPLSVTISGVEVTPADARSVELSTARTSITVLGELFSLPVRVIGQLGQGLEGANVRVVKGAVTVASSSTDSGGFAQFDRLVLDTYTVVANYKGYSQEVSVSSADLQAGRVVEITLPVYTELLGIPMPLSTLLALIIGLILLVVVLAIIVSEYRWWRGRRLGVYPPAPPKAPK